MTEAEEVRPQAGWVAPEVEDELPGLGLHWARLPAPSGSSSPALVQRLQELANGFRGPAVIAMRTKPVPAAYRNFFRQIGLDPDVTRPPGEQAALSRLFHGTFQSHGRIADALLVALLETGFPIWALDARRARGEELCIRTARPDERIGSAASGLPIEAGTLVVSDKRTVHAVLFGEHAEASAIGADTAELVLYGISVAGVPAIHVDEAFWLAAEALREG